MIVSEFIKDAVDLALWESVPGRVRSLYKQAAGVAQAIERAVSVLPLPGSDPVGLWWDPATKHVYVSLPDGAADAENRWYNALKNITQVDGVTIDCEWVPQNAAECVRIKTAAALDFIGKPWMAANNALGGPSPLSSAIVGGLLMGAGGYGVGAAAEHLFPERYMDRGRLRRSLGLMGLAAGTVPGLWKGTAHMRNSAAVGKPLGWRAFITPDADVPLNPQAPNLSPAARVPLDAINVTPRFAASASKIAQAMFPRGGGLGIDSVPVDAFNRAVWNDVRKGVAAHSNPFGTKDRWHNNEQELHTPPAIGAAAAGIMAGVQAQRGGAALVSPRDIVYGLASAGIGLATANTAGRMFSAMAGLTPAAQEQLQNTGIWAGLLNSIVPKLF